LSVLNGRLRTPTPAGPLVLITDCDHPDTDIERAIFATAGLDVRVANCRTEDEVLAAGVDAVALLVQYAPISSKVLAGLDGCQVVGRYGAGLDTIDLSAARSRGVDVVSVPDYSVQEVSDHTIALALCLCRRIVAYTGAVRSGHWDMREEGVMHRLSTLRLGVIGLGRIGRLVAAKAAALNFEVVGHDVIPPAEPGVPLLSLEELLATSDVVTLHLPLSTESHHLIDASRLALMRPTAMLINTSRGGLVDQAALAQAMADGRLGGAGLDVLELEPPDPADPLIRDERVIITPHVAFYSEESLAELNRRAAENIVQALARRGLIDYPQARWTPRLRCPASPYCNTRKEMIQELDINETIGALCMLRQSRSRKKKNAHPRHMRSGSGVLSRGCDRAIHRVMAATPIFCPERRTCSDSRLRLASLNLSLSDPDISRLPADRAPILDIGRRSVVPHDSSFAPGMRDDNRVSRFKDSI
jgi:D-3-phosphoglycerate dehydrogenase